MKKLTKDQYITYLIDSKGFTKEEAKEYLSKEGVIDINTEALAFWDKNEENKTKLFFVVDSLESNEEIFETYEEANRYLNTGFFDEDKPRLYIAMVRNYFYEEELKSWNYDDYADTFTIIKILN